LLATLAQQGILERVEHGRYRLGLGLFELGSLVPARLELREAALPHLKTLVRWTRETVHLAVRKGSQIIYVDKVEPVGSLPMFSRIGRRAPMHSTGVGKALLAFQTPEVVDGIIDTGLSRLTPSTIVDRVALLDELARVREMGCAHDVDETQVGLRCVAAPIRDGSGEVVASLSVAGRAHRMTTTRMQELRRQVVDTAREVSLGLGYWPPRAR
jgi:DNA-binding IclR family transcriptional regulator